MAAVPTAPIVAKEDWWTRVFHTSPTKVSFDYIAMTPADGSKMDLFKVIPVEMGEGQDSMLVKVEVNKGQASNKAEVEVTFSGSEIQFL